MTLAVRRLKQISTKCSVVEDLKCVLLHRWRTQKSARPTAIHSNQDLCVCMCVNQGDRNNRYTRRLVILYAQTY